MSIKKIYSIFEQIKADNSKTAKEIVLAAHIEDEPFREVLSFLYDDYITTGLSTRKINKEVRVDVEHSIEDLSDLIAYLKEGKTGRDYDIQVIQNYISTLDSDDLKQFVKDIATKKLKVGITKKTVNKVYGKGTIPEFGVMLAENFTEHEKKIDGKFYITLKIDGNRCVAMKENGVVSFFTRKGKPIEGLTELAKDFAELPDGFVYDGEALLRNGVDKLKLSIPELFRATQKAMRKDGEKKNIDFYIFDMIPIEEFKEGKSKKTYEQRRNTLETLGVYGLEHIYVLKRLYAGEDKEVIGVIMKQVIEEGYEGIMINNADAYYVTKRTTDLQKVKEFKTGDLLVMSIEKAIDGQFKDMMARVNVEYKGNLVGVGSGFTIEERIRFTENPDLIVGKIIEVQYHEESQDEKTGLPSMRFPTFKVIRDDKTVDDIRYE